MGVNPDQARPGQTWAGQPGEASRGAERSALSGKSHGCHALKRNKPNDAARQKEKRAKNGIHFVLNILT